LGVVAGAVLVSGDGKRLCSSDGSELGAFLLALFVCTEDGCVVGLQWDSLDVTELGQLGDQDGLLKGMVFGDGEVRGVDVEAADGAW
jgi:hypothetical protein